MPFLIDVSGWKNGINSHKTIAQTRARGGAIENSTGLIRDVVFWDFENSFRASANGRRRAIIEALLGPLRS